MAWFILFLAGVCEVIWAAGLKVFGFRLSWGGAMVVVVMLLSFVLLEIAMRSLPLGTAYAVWTGIGAVGTAIYGMYWLNEPRDVWRVLCIVLIVSGIAGLKLAGGKANREAVATDVRAGS